MRHSELTGAGVSTHDPTFDTAPRGLRQDGAPAATWTMRSQLGTTSIE